MKILKQNKRILLITALILITILGGVLRFYQLGKAPAGFYIDEAGQGYSAYSILKTGQDEFGKTFPVVFRSFTDFKTPIYTYLIVPLIPFLGLTIFTIRFPSAFFGVLTIPLLFFLIQSLVPNFKRQTLLAGIAAFFLAISPWHILFSRTDYECNVALFCYLLGVFLFYIGLKKPWILLSSAALLAVSFIAYQSERVTTPLTVVALIIRFRKELLNQKLKPFVLGAVILAVIIILPALLILPTPGFLARASGLNIFSHQKQLPSGTIEKYNGPLNGLVNGSWFLSSKEFASLYFSYYSPRNMFNLGDYGERSSFPDLATFFVWQFPFYLLGLFVILGGLKTVTGKELGELKFFCLFLLIVAPIPAAVTRDPYTTIRALPLVIPQIILVSLGLVGLLGILGGKLKSLVIVAIALLIVYSVFQLYSSVIILNEYYRAPEWDYGLADVSAFLQDKYQTIPAVVDNSRDEEYIQLAFFLKYDPSKYQQENFEVTPEEYYTNMNRTTEKHIGKITTRPINWQKDLQIDQFLIGDELAISYNQIEEHHLRLEKEIKYPDGSVAFRIVRTNPEYELSNR